MSSFGGLLRRQEIGLGNALALQRVEVRWPLKTSERSSELAYRTQLFEGLEPRNAYRLTEAKREPERLEHMASVLGGERR